MARARSHTSGSWLLWTDSNRSKQARKQLKHVMDRKYKKATAWNRKNTIGETHWERSGQSANGSRHIHAYNSEHKPNQDLPMRKRERTKREPITTSRIGSRGGTTGALEFRRRGRRVTRLERHNRRGVNLNGRRGHIRRSNKGRTGARGQLHVLVRRSASRFGGRGQ